MSGTMDANTLTGWIEKLGFYAVAHDLRRNAISVQAVLGHIDQRLKEKRVWLRGHTVSAGTVSQETYERIEAWCVQAEEILQQATPPSPGPMHSFDGKCTFPAQKLPMNRVTIVPPEDPS
jgi:hypothetical protein